MGLGNGLGPRWNPSSWLTELSPSGEQRKKTKDNSRKPLVGRRVVNVDVCERGTGSCTTGPTSLRALMTMGLGSQSASGVGGLTVIIIALGGSLFVT